jgi:hypothetical protein
LANRLFHDCPVLESPSSPERSAALRRRAPRGQRGEGKIKTILFLLIFAAIIFVGFKTVPAYVAEFQLSDKMQETARFAIVQHQSEDQIREAIFKVMQDLGIPAKSEDIKLDVTQQFVTITVDYHVPVDLLVFQTDLHFTPTASNKSLN